MAGLTRNGFNSVLVSCRIFNTILKEQSNRGGRTDEPAEFGAGALRKPPKKNRQTRQ
jgi:hypothetical protein